MFVAAGRSWNSCAAADADGDGVFNTLDYAVENGNAVPVTLSVYEGVLHGFLHYSAVEPRAMQAIREGAAFLRALR